MINIEEFYTMVKTACDELPDIFFEGLNLGVIIDENIKYHPISKDLLILGEYIINKLGKQIFIYYGSFVKKYNHINNKDILQEEIREIIRHEFTHHMEHKAGIKDLEIKDKIFLNKFVKNM